MANPNSILAFESRFGPQSNFIDVAAFVRSASDLTPFQAGDVDHEIIQECRCVILLSTSRPWSNEIHKDRDSVEDLKTSLEDVLNNPRLAAHVLKNHEFTVNAIHESADTSGKRKRRRMNLPEPAFEHPEVTALQRKLDAVKLKSWPFLLDSAAFLRGPRFTDLNPFTEPVCKQLRLTYPFPLRLFLRSHQKRTSSSDAATVSSNNEAVLTVTVYHRLPYRSTAVARSSRHALLSSQNLGELVNCIPCTSNEMPEEVYQDGELVGYDPNTIHKNPGVVVFVEGVLYDDGQDEQDYARCVNFADRILSWTNPPPMIANY